MHKMAIFVEGRTELEFDTKLIEEIASAKSAIIESRRIRGGTTVRRTMELIKSHPVGKSSPATHFFLIYDCGNDALVKDRMIEEYDNLAKAGYSKILCHRDVAPTFTHAELAKLQSKLPLFVKTKPIPVTFILSVMEVEAWFLAEHTHFQKIDPSITLASIIAALKFDPSTDDLQLRPSPAADLSDCYGIAARTYDKPTSQATIDVIDYLQVYFELTQRFPHLATLCHEIEAFLSPPVTAA